MMSQFLQPDFSKGDPNTLGGYAAVHDRPAAFEGADGFSYSVEILADDDEQGQNPWGAYLFFVKWTRIARALQRYSRFDVMARGATEAQARERLGAMSLADSSVRRLARCPRVAARRSEVLDAMHLEDEGEMRPVARLASRQRRQRPPGRLSRSDDDGTEYEATCAVACKSRTRQTGGGSHSPRYRFASATKLKLAVGDL